MKHLDNSEEVKFIGKKDGANRFFTSVRVKYGPLAENFSLF